MLCTGLYHNPVVPFFKGQEKFEGKIVHSSEVKDSKSLTGGKKVIIVGGDKSSWDMIKLSCRHSDKVTNVLRKAHLSFPIKGGYFLGLPSAVFA